MLFPHANIENHPAGTLDINPIINGNWKHLANWLNPGDTYLASQDSGVAGVAGNQVRSNSGVFTADDVGATVRFANGLTAQVSAFTSATVVTVTDSKLVTSQAFELYREGEKDRTALARGLVKRPRMVAADDGKILSWSNTSQRCDLITRPGFNATNKAIFYGRTGLDFGTSADLTWDDSTKVLAAVGFVSAKRYDFTHATIASGTSVSIDFALESFRSINTLAHNVTFTTANLVLGRQQSVRIVCDGTTRTLAFPGTWKWLNSSMPASIAANKTGILSLTAYGTADSDVVAVWAVEA